jgi:two-component system sensor histidine kinase RegB
VITATLSASASNLQRLAIIRSLLLAVLSGLVVYAYHWLGLPLNFTGLLSTLLILTVITTLTLWRCQQAWPVTDYEFFGQLLIDIGGLSILLYLSGGATNPFVSYYLVPLCISALVLPWAYSWALAACSLSLYSLLLFYHQPFPELLPEPGPHAHHGNTEGGLNLHILGMWFNFAISALLITFFVVRMANALRQRDEQLAEDREDELRDEQVMAVATLAAGTAHELGTPLSTMTVLLDEIKAEHPDSKNLTDDIQLLQQQVQSCRSILKGLVRTAEIHNQSQRLPIAIDQFLKQTLEHWQVLRPTANYQLNISQTTAAPLLATDSTLEQAINNLLNNAADASKQTVDVSLRWDSHAAHIEVRDHGPGLSVEILEQLGKPFVTTKGKGLGLGLFLTHATIKRYGGEIQLYNHPEQGSIAELTLPLYTKNKP